MPASNRTAHLDRVSDSVKRISWGEIGILALLLLGAFVAWALAYQAPIYARLAIGGDAASQRREDDAPFLSGFNGSEPYSGEDYRWWTLPPGYAYRWTTSDATIRFPGVGGGRWIMRLYASSGHADGTDAAVQWHFDNRSPTLLAISAHPRIYHLLGPINANGDLALHFQADAYTSPDDPRALGFVIRDVRLEPTSGLHTPALPYLYGLAATLILIYVLARWLALPINVARLLILTGTGIILLLLATNRLALTLIAPILPALALGCAALALSLQAILRRWGTSALPDQHAAGAAIGGIVVLVALAFALRAGGMLHPYALFSDAGLNANNLLETSLGIIYFTEGLPAEAGGGQAPYPPGVYLLLAPWQLIVPVGHVERILLIQIGVAALDSLVVALIWLLLRRSGARQSAALLGAAFYLLPPPLLESFSIGEYANIGGQALALPAIALLAWDAGQTRNRTGIVWLTLALVVGLLAHSGVTLSLGALFAAAWGISIIGDLRQRATRTLAYPTGDLALAGALALGIVVLVYYTAPQFLALFAERFGEGAATTNAAALSPMEKIGDLALSTLGLARPGGRTPLPLLLVISGLAGVALIAGQRNGRTAQWVLASVLIAWWVGTLISQGIILIADQGVRWAHFLYPALCLGAGPTLGAFWQHGKWGKAGAALILAITLVYGLTIWIVHLRDYLHI